MKQTCSFILLRAMTLAFFCTYVRMSYNQFWRLTSARARRFGIRIVILISLRCWKIMTFQLRIIWQHPSAACERGNARSSADLRNFLFKLDLEQSFDKVFFYSDLIISYFYVQLMYPTQLSAANFSSNTARFCKGTREGFLSKSMLACIGLGHGSW